MTFSPLPARRLIVELAWAIPSLNVFPFDLFYTMSNAMREADLVAILRVRGDDGDGDEECTISLLELVSNDTEVTKHIRDLKIWPLPVVWLVKRGGSHKLPYYSPTLLRLGEEAICADECRDVEVEFRERYMQVYMVDPETSSVVLTLSLYTSLERIGSSPITLLDTLRMGLVNASDILSKAAKLGDSDCTFTILARHAKHMIALIEALTSIRVGEPSSCSRVEKLKETADMLVSAHRIYCLGSINSLTRILSAGRGKVNVLTILLLQLPAQREIGERRISFMCVKTVVNLSLLLNSISCHLGERLETHIRQVIIASDPDIVEKLFTRKLENKLKAKLDEHVFIGSISALKYGQHERVDNVIKNIVSELEPLLDAVDAIIVYIVSDYRKDVIEMLLDKLASRRKPVAVIVDPEAFFTLSHDTYTGTRMINVSNTIHAEPCQYRGAVLAITTLLNDTSTEDEGR